MPSASRTFARPSLGGPQSVASSGRVERPSSPRPAETEAAGWVVTIEPSRTQTGMRSSGAGTTTSRPPTTRAPVQKSIQRPRGR